MGCSGREWEAKKDVRVRLQGSEGRWQHGREPGEEEDPPAKRPGRKGKRRRVLKRELRRAPREGEGGLGGFNDFSLWVPGGVQAEEQVQ